MRAQAVADVKDLSRSGFFDADEKYLEIKSHLTSAQALAMEESTLEKWLETDGRELLRRLLQGHIDLRAGLERDVGRADPIVGRDGVERTHERSSERGLMTIFGPVRVPRIEHGGRGLTSLHPLDAELNLPADSFSFCVRRRCAEEASKNSFDESTASVASTTGALVAKRQVEELTVRAAADFEEFYAGRAAMPDHEISGDILVISVDGKGVVMRHEDLRPATKAAAEKGKHKLEHRLSKGEKGNRKRMAMVAAVYTIAAFIRSPEDIVRDLSAVRVPVPSRPKPEFKRVWASLVKSPRKVVREAFEEALRRDPMRRRTWVALSDGNKTQIKELRRAARKFGVKLVLVVDLIHVLEYLWKATTAFNKEGTPEAERWVSERLLEVLRGKAGLVAGGIRRSATRRGLSNEDRRSADACAKYLRKYKRLLRYDEFLARGLPIATGVIEGACRHLIADRMDITGARWRLLRAEAVLRLRALRSSGDFDEYWAFHQAKERARNHTSRYAAEIIPPLRGSACKTGRNRLRLVN